MKITICKFISFSLLAAILITSPEILLAQNNRLVGELTVIKNTASGGEDYVMVNGARAVSGRSIVSPSEIVTSSQTKAKIVLPQTGTIFMSPDSKLNLSFINASITGEFSAGEITVETVPNTAVNLLTTDGTITIPNQNQTNIVKISIENGRTRINTLTGQAMFNNVSVAAGESYPAATTDKTNSKKPAKPAGSAGGGGFNPLIIIGVLGAAAAAALIALSASSNNSDTPVVSPTR